MIRTLLVVALGLGPALAHADEATARKLYDEGERAYNLGQFPRAIELFTKAYEQSPEPAFLFNIAQTYRQVGDCRQASFFYKRFLALKQNDTKKPLKPELKAEVEKRINELEDCIKREIASKPPDALDNGTTTSTSTTAKPGPPGTGTTSTNASATNPTTRGTTSTAQAENSDEGGEDEGGEETPTQPDAGQPKLLSVRVLAGAAKLNAGSLDTPVQFAGTLIGGYPLALAPKLELDLGVALSFTPVPYTTTADVSGSGALFGILADVAPSYTIIPKLAARADVGLGALVFSGLEKDGNPFTDMGLPATGPLAAFMIRAAVSADYAITPNVIVTATPLAFSYSPAPSGFQSSISSLSTLSFMAGVGYRR